MSLFPAYIEDELEEELQEVEETPREYGVDFTTGQLTGKIVEGIEAIKVWVYFALQVARYRFHICSWNYGNETEELYGKGYSAGHIKSEMARMITECLLANKYIKNVEVTETEYINGKFAANITITTTLDEIDTIPYETEVA